MADNYLEKQYDAYLLHKEAKEKERRLRCQKQLKAYKARLEKEKQAAKEAAAGEHDAQES